MCIPLLLSVHPASSHLRGVGGTGGRCGVTSHVYVGNRGAREARHSQGLPRPKVTELRLSGLTWGRGLGGSKCGTSGGPGPSLAPGPHTPRPLSQESECCQVLQPVSPAGLGPGSPGQGTLSSVPPRPHGPRGPRPPPAPHAVLSAAALLRVCFCQAGPGTSRPRRCQGPSSQALGAPWVPSAARPRAQSSL